MVRLNGESLGAADQARKEELQAKLDEMERTIQTINNLASMELCPETAWQALCTSFDIPFEPVRYTASEWKEKTEREQEEQEGRDLDKIQDETGMNREDAKKEKERREEAAAEEAKRAQEEAAAQAEQARVQQEATETAALDERVSQRATQDGISEGAARELIEAEEEARSDADEANQTALGEQATQDALTAQITAAASLPPDMRQAEMDRILAQQNVGKRGDDVLTMEQLQANAQQDLNETQQLLTTLQEQGHTLPTNATPQQIAEFVSSLPQEFKDANGGGLTAAQITNYINNKPRMNTIARRRGSLNSRRNCGPGGARSGCK